MSKGLMLLTCAGESRRFEGWGPKWRLTHPSGNIMAAEAARPFAEHWQTVVVLAGVDERIPSSSSVEAVVEEFSKAGICDALVVVLETKTAHRMETVRQALSMINGSDDAPLLVRDCDNLVEANILPGERAISVCDALKFGPINPKELSFLVRRSGNGYVRKIAEDDLVTRWFCSGAYAFARASDLRKVRKAKTMADALQEVYIGTTSSYEVRAADTTRYFDWGTGNKWCEFKRSYRTIFLDIDGVLLESSHRTFGKTWRDSKPLMKNCGVVLDLYETGRYHIVLCTSRPEVVRDWTIIRLKRAGVLYDQLIMGLPACGRLLVNDVVEDRFDHTAEAVEVVRDEDGSLIRALKKVGL